MTFSPKNYYFILSSPNILRISHNITTIFSLKKSLSGTNTPSYWKYSLLFAMIAWSSDYLSHEYKSLKTS